MVFIKPRLTPYFLLLLYALLFFMVLKQRFAHLISFTMTYVCIIKDTKQIELYIKEIIREVLKVGGTMPAFI